MATTNYKEDYSIEQHALDMFRENYKIFLSKEKDKVFDIKPYSEEYYVENIDCFRHRDRNEVGGFIRELTERGFIRPYDKALYEVVITEKGYTELSSWETHIAKVFG